MLTGRYARKHIGKEMSLRLTPEIRFVFDDSIERSERVRLHSFTCWLTGCVQVIDLNKRAWQQRRC